MKKAKVTKQTERADFFAAYSDCNDGPEERNLSFISAIALDAKTLKEVMPSVVPEGYNEFDSIVSITALIETFGEKSQYYIAREGSVCIYVKPSGNIWMERMKLQCDELLFCGEKQMFRVWWD